MDVKLYFRCKFNKKSNQLVQVIEKITKFATFLSYVNQKER